MPIAPFVRRRRYPIIEGDTATYAADFERDNSEYLSVADPWTSGDIDFSVACWVNHEAPTTVNHVIMSKDTAGAVREWMLWMPGNGNHQFYLFNGAGGVLGLADGATGGAPVVGTWYFLFAYHDKTANQVGISVNDGAVDTGATSGPAVDTVEPFHIGGMDIHFHDGLIARAGFWKKRLSTAEVTTLYGLGPKASYADLSALIKTNLVSWYPLKEESGTRVDAHGSNNLTDNNTVGRALVVYP